jgi:hypothetical protein
MLKACLLEKVGEAHETLLEQVREVHIDSLFARTRRRSKS